MPTAQDLGAVSYERQGHVFRVLSDMLSGVAAQGSTYITATLWEAVRSFYVGWKWAMDSLTDGFKAAAYDPTVSTGVASTLGGVAANASTYFGSSIGGRGYLTGAAIEALRTPDAYNQATNQWAAGASYLFQKVAEVYALFWRNAP